MHPSLLNFIHARSLLHIIVQRPPSRILLYPTACQRPPSSSLSRRAFLPLLCLLPIALAPAAANARRKPSKPLVSALIPLVRVRDSLPDLANGLEQGSYGDVRQVMKTMLTGNRLGENVEEASLYVEGDESEEVIRHGKEAMEYLDQVVMYFDPMEVKKKPTRVYMDFVRKALDAAREELDKALVYFPSKEVEYARQQLVMEVAGY